MESKRKRFPKYFPKGKNLKRKIVLQKILKKKSVTNMTVHLPRTLDLTRKERKNLLSYFAQSLSSEPLHFHLFRGDTLILSIIRKLYRFLKYI